MSEIVAMKTAPAAVAQNRSAPARDRVPTDERGRDRVVGVAAGQEERRVLARRADQDARTGGEQRAIRRRRPSVSSVIGSAAARAAVRFSPSR